VKNLTTTEEIIDWIAGICQRNGFVIADTETAAYLAKCVRLSQACSWCRENTETAAYLARAVRIAEAYDATADAPCNCAALIAAAEAVEMSKLNAIYEAVEGDK